ncbi:hypothetical protein DHEL01_v210839 [Diaporthe helianthi]|uniref:Peptidase A1 domain-containing protein n=1 Tax=Diaporthe helianthi TaxID=158607 RepID=A0A2P5HKH4_DIAHE|nr:hypothetical protein DHEL01_v210839 [Diaporthe helianthi]
MSFIHGALAATALTSLAVVASEPSSSKSTQVGAPYLRSQVTTHRDNKLLHGQTWGKFRRASSKRQDATPLENQQTGTMYTIDIEIGTPPQPLTLILDTGSSELWVNPNCATSGQPDYCESFSQFDYASSSTSTDTGYSNILAYGKGNVTIEYVTDVVSVGSASITDQIFGVGVESYDIPIGILGLAPPTESEPLYTYVLDNMVEQGLIDSRAFSLDLRDVDSPDGSVIFGGVDTGKFIGELQKCPILDPLDTPSGADRYWIYLTGLGMTLPSGESGLIAEGELPVFLDSGGTMTRLPTEVFEAIGSVFAGAQYDSESGFFIIDCDVGDSSGSVDFVFGEKVISVAFDDFIWRVPDVDDACVLGVLADDEEPVLGDTFLRAAYVVYDQDNRNLHLAQAANCGTSLMAISSGSDAVPSVMGDCTATAEAGALTASLTATEAPSTITNGPGGLNSAIAPGPGDTQTGGKVASSLCLTCKNTATAAVNPSGTTRTANAGVVETGSPLAAVGAMAIAALLI